MLVHRWRQVHQYRRLKLINLQLFNQMKNLKLCFLHLLKMSLNYNFKNHKKKKLLKIMKRRKMIHKKKKRLNLKRMNHFIKISKKMNKMTFRQKMMLIKPRRKNRKKTKRCNLTNQKKRKKKLQVNQPRKKVEWSKKNLIKLKKSKVHRETIRMPILILLVKKITRVSWADRNLSRLKSKKVLSKDRLKSFKRL